MASPHVMTTRSAQCKKFSFGPFSPPPGLEKPAGNGSMPPNSLGLLSRVQANSTYSPALVSAASEPDPLVRMYQEFLQLRTERVQHELKVNMAASKPGSKQPSLVLAPLKPPGVFIKSDSAHSLVSKSTAATEEVEDDHCDKGVLNTPAAVETVATEKLSRDLWVENVGVDGHLKVHWLVDAKRLRTKDQQIVSRSFEISPGCSFKLMLKPTTTGEKKGQACFQKARGCGSVDLKLTECAGVAPTLQFGISVGQGSTRGPVQHDFNNSIVGSLSKSDYKFDFQSAVDRESSTFLVSLEVLPA